jgi:hypothetical protein
VLKNAISACAKSKDGDTALFKQLLQAEMKKVSAFYTTQWCVSLFRGRRGAGGTRGAAPAAC